MTAEEKLTAVRAEIKRRYHLAEQNYRTGLAVSSASIIAYYELLSFMDSMQEEPVSEDKITISKEWFEHCKKSWYNEGYIDGEYNRDRQFEESVSEDLEEAVNAYIGYAPEVDESSFTYGKRQAFKAGAQWQKEKDSIPAKDLEESISYLSKRYPEVSFAKLSRIAVYIARWQKHQIIGNASEWLDENLINYWGQQNANNTEEFIDDFKKAMEE